MVNITRLETMTICVLDAVLGVRQVFRALLDSGSTDSFVLENVAKKLHLTEISRQLLNISVFGRVYVQKSCATVQASVFRNPG